MKYTLQVSFIVQVEGLVAIKKKMSVTLRKYLFAKISGESCKVTLSCTVDVTKPFTYLGLVLIGFHYL